MRTLEQKMAYKFHLSFCREFRSAVLNHATTKLCWLVSISVASSLCIPASAQSLTATDSSGQQIGSSNPSYIEPTRASDPDTGFPYYRPVYDRVELAYVQHGGACGTINYDLESVKWTASIKTNEVVTTQQCKTVNNTKCNWKKTGSTATPSNPNYNATAGTNLISGTLQCGQAATLDWSQMDHFYGGNAVLSWTFSDGYTTVDGAPIQFQIQGHNPSQTVVQADIQSAPWFYTFILGQESKTKQFVENASKQSINYPVVGGNPEGIGIAQLDYQTSYISTKPQHTPAQLNDTRQITTHPYAKCAGGVLSSGSNTCPQAGFFWNYVDNLTEGMQKLRGFTSTGVKEWQKEFNLMLSSLQTAGLDRSNPANWIFPAVYTSKDCSFNHTWPVTSAYRGYEAAYIIRSYNQGSAPGTYVWQAAHPPTKGNPGSWSAVNDPPPQNYHSKCGGYLACVCGQ